MNVWEEWKDSVIYCPASMPECVLYNSSWCVCSGVREEKGNGALCCVNVSCSGECCQCCSGAGETHHYPQPDMVQMFRNETKSFVSAIKLDLITQSRSETFCCGALRTSSLQRELRISTAVVMWSFLLHRGWDSNLSTQVDHVLYMRLLELRNMFIEVS